jgi:hypothetical protein
MNAASRIALLIVTALAVALTANLVLLDLANGPKDPVGQLNPRAGIVRPPAPGTTTTHTRTRTRTVPTPLPPRGSEGPRGSHPDD